MPNAPRRRKITTQHSPVSRIKSKQPFVLDPIENASSSPPLSVTSLNEDWACKEDLPANTTTRSNKGTKIISRIEYSAKKSTTVDTPSSNQSSLSLVDQEFTTDTSNIENHEQINHSPGEQQPEYLIKPKTVTIRPKNFGRLPLNRASDTKSDYYYNPRRARIKNQKQKLINYIIPTVLTIESSTSATSLPSELNVVMRSVSLESCHSGDRMCRICHGGDSLQGELGKLVSACACRGTVGNIHVKCLERWLTESGKSRCELCGTKYSTRRVHKYGVLKALLMWILSHNAKQLMIDSLGIMLMSPLAVLAAWLSGRTLAGLMTQEAEVTPWPLASTFVLACMTLVCYYCWIVSAATRHALGWWVWYRAQYEVKLELDNEGPTG